MNNTFSRKFLKVFFLILTLGLTQKTGLAQQTRSYFSGTANDQSGAVMSGVKVTLTNQDTAADRTINTNDSGFFRFAAIEPGTYSLRAEFQGFRPIEIHDISVKSTGETVVNVTLEVAGGATEVEVMESTVGMELQKADASIGRTLANREVKELPLSAARDVNQIALLAPNTFNAPGSTGISANGQRARNNNFLIDGTENNDLSVTLQVIPITPEAVGEYQYQTNAYAAEFGRNSGAQINVITKSGTNSLHGEFWDYYRGSALNALDPDEKAAGLTRPARFNRNQFGADAGGPIIKNRTFVFGLFQGDRDFAAPSPGASVRIPTPAGFAALSRVPLRPAQAGQPAQSPTSRKAALDALNFLNGIYSQNPVFANVLPAATGFTVNGIPIESGQTNINLAQPFSRYQVLVRGDHKLTEKDTLTARYIYHKSDDTNVVSNCNFGPIFCGNQAVLSQNAQLSLTHVFTPRVVNEFRTAYIRRDLAFPENAPNQPSVAVGAFNIGGLGAFPQGRVQNDFQWSDIVSWQTGRNGFKFGADIHRNRLFNLAAFDSKGTWSFSNFSDFVNNSAFSFTQALNTATFDARQTQLFFFAQDDVKVTPNLTFNLGLRYENSSVPFGFFGATDPQVKAALVPGPVKRDNHNWAPRIGLAWSPRPSDGFFQRLVGDGKTAFRAGYGISYDVLFYNILTVNASNFPRVVVFDQRGPGPVDVFPTQQPGSVTPIFNPLATFVNAPENTVNPYAQLYSLTIQRELPGNLLLEFGYTGSRGVHGIRQGQLNPAILTEAQAQTVRSTGSITSIPTVQQRRLSPQFGSRITIESTANSSYNAFFVSLNKRLSHGLQFGANYTLSKTMSDNDESLGVGAITNSSPQVPQDYFNPSRPEKSVSVFDRPHRFVAYYLYDLPWFQSGALANPAVKNIIGGWQIEGTTTMQAGQPFTIRTGVDTNGNGDSAGDRPDFNPAALGSLTKDPKTHNLRSFTVPLQNGPFVTFLSPTTGTPLPNTKAGGGNLGRNTFRGPGFITFNFGVIKKVHIWESHQLQFRADILNLFNHLEWGNPVATMNSPNFGKNLNGPSNGFAIPRTMTLSIKYSF